MKRSLALAVTLASGFAMNAVAQTSTPAPAAAPAPAGPAKVAVIAFQAAVMQTNEGQRNLADLEKKYEPKQQQLKALNDDIEGKKKQLQAQADKLSDAEKNARAKDIDDKEKQLQRSAEDARNDFQQESQDVYLKLAQKFYEVATAYAQQQGYTVVLDFGAQNSPVLWAAESTNVTKPVIDAYNVKSGVPAPAAPAAAAPSPTRTTPATHPH